MSSMVITTDSLPVFAALTHQIYGPRFMRETLVDSYICTYRGDSFVFKLDKGEFSWGLKSLMEPT